MNKVINNPNTPRFWNKYIFDTYFKLKKSPFYIDKIKRVSSFLRGKRGNMLDIGFGAGYLEEQLEQQKSALKIFGVDFSIKAVLNARKKHSGKFVVGHAERLPFENNFFEWVIVLDVLEHFTEEDVKGVLTEISRVTKKDGYLIVSVPLNENLDKMNRENTNFNKHLRRYTIKSVDAEIKSFNFKIVRRDFIIAFRTLYFIKKLVAKVVKNIRKPNLYILYARKT